MTLIEILIVVVLIVGIAAVAIPGYNLLLQKTYMANSASNLSNIGMGLRLFAQDNGDILPWRAGSNPVDPPKGGVPWCEWVNPYLGGKDTNSSYDYSFNPVWYCRNASQDSVRRSQKWGDWQIASARRHYGLNVFIYQPAWAQRWSRIPDPSRIVIVGETNGGFDIIDPRDRPVHDGARDTRYRVSHPGKTGLYLFGDGRVEALKGDQGFNVNRNMWNW